MLATWPPGAQPIFQDPNLVSPVPTIVDTTILSLSMTLGKFGDKVSALKLPCCQGQLPSFPRVTLRP